LQEGRTYSFSSSILFQPSFLPVVAEIEAIGVPADLVQEGQFPGQHKPDIDRLRH